ncbi:bifunctional diaminohydroxyphosphoribosylaminopyrimidine deaminase/5-amino-6-(5-phosphoribosylamino)uracil reductase RibD [Parasphingopyxis sp. CP4]|uniref:bifunctional diaminohydroxyphosphoribosylaminopyrimidine deaminase/5-amino-6-(5-phosphoribosylamino)uracil reductase RibD n=1 Tax=Parasphingopyxis sp. CP4 TaxID=2724527 RepID=UPI0015A4C491|nr:bifunctional diaminohydroxyphosphoribosylaminopyrimidine deaminase/5-amino-6-(5-phosphoribosylamino)uracil reductase RibD [Parasphingopyxis sp. CP4]QLC23515.1 bifunctional diaminohydroxyphosphoribosylaminopyrimidine deaminase/5-amino-6-(5-phosphoribosylamino)uracil reductase RibD [Parasphingopyxis sp. CP4]
MAAALALSWRGRGRTAPNPNVGCIIARDGQIVSRGWTRPGGRPHAEADALDGVDARGADIYTTLEPCAHKSERGPACADLLVKAAPARVIIAAQDPDTRTNGAGTARLRDAGITVTEGVRTEEAHRAMAGFFTRQAKGRPHVTLKLATSLDGQVALPDGSSQWITGPEARAHAHVERALSDMVVVGRGTVAADQPQLDVRLTGLEPRTPGRAVLSSEYSNFAQLQLKADNPVWQHLESPEAIADLENVDYLLVEGGAGAAAAFVAADLVDRLLLYRAPILVGTGLSALGDFGLAQLDDAHGQWRLVETRMLGVDRMEVYEKA